MALNPKDAADKIKSRLDKLDPSEALDNKIAIVAFAEEILNQVGEPTEGSAYIYGILAELPEYE